MYCDETYLYYDCSDIDVYEPNMGNDVFISAADYHYNLWRRVR